MADRWPIGLRFGGLGGQGLVTLGAVLAEAAAAAGLTVAASQSYGSRARGGATRSDVILSDALIDFPHVHHPDLLVVLAQQAFDLYAPEVAADGLILADTFFVDGQAPEGVRLLGLDGTGTAMAEVGNKVAANFVMFGALVGFSGIIEPRFVEAAIGRLVRARFVDVNKKALATGIGLGEGLRQREGPWR